MPSGVIGLIGSEMSDLPIYGVSDENRRFAVVVQRLIKFPAV